MVISLLKNETVLPSTPSLFCIFQGAQSLLEKGERRVKYKGQDPGVLTDGLLKYSHTWQPERVTAMENVSINIKLHPFL